MRQVRGRLTEVKDSSLALPGPGQFPVADNIALIKQAPAWLHQANIIITLENETLDVYNAWKQPWSNLNPIFTIRFPAGFIRETMTSKINILITGVTGYIGGTVLACLLARPDFSDVNITALLRSSEKATKLRALGVIAVVGSHDDQTLMTTLAAESDIVIATI